MRDDSNKLIHEALCDFGYQNKGYSLSIGMTRYHATIKVGGNNSFLIELILDFDKPFDFLNLPKVRILEFPKNIPMRMPHVEANQNLCYLDKEGVYLDPFTPYESFCLLLGQVNKVLSGMVNSSEKEVADEHAYEFVSYWKASARILVATTDDTGLVYLYERQGLYSDSSVKELVYLSSVNPEQNDIWFSSVPGLSEKPKTSISAILIESEQKPLIKKGEPWPPSSFREFHDWFKRIDSGQSRYMIEQFKKYKKKFLIVIVKFKGEHIISFDLRKTDFGHTAFQSLNARCTKNKKHKKRKNRRVLEILSSSKMIEPINRYYGEDVTKEFIRKRNSTLSLIDKKIVVIGCGTIGGYLVHSLAQCGAGTGLGILKLYDPDEYSPGNIGRHILGGRYLRQQKSVAMKYMLQDEFYNKDLHIEATGTFEYSNIDSIRAYDLLIDVTGNSQFSTMLSHHWHKYDGRKPALLHGWIDASGDTVRGLLDDGKKACYNCISEKRFQVYKRGVKGKAIRNSCAGASYFEFTSAPSMSAAALTLDKTVKYLNGHKIERFSQHRFSDDVKYLRNQNPERTKGCPCCLT